MPWTSTTCAWPSRVLGLVLFLGIVAWAWSARRRDGFDEAAQLPFLDDEPAPRRPQEKSNERLRQQRLGAVHRRGHRRRPGRAACVLLIVRQPAQGHGRRQHHRPRLGRGPAELNNPLPRWWMWLFVITVVFAVVYLALYPGLGSYAGTLGWTSAGQYEAEQQKAQRRDGAGLRQVRRACRPRQLAKDPQAMAHRRAPVRQQLRAVPRLRRARQQGLPEPDRRRLAVRRRRRGDRRRPSPTAASA